MIKATIKVLSQQCEALGLTPVPTKTKADGTSVLRKKDYVKALRDHYLRVTYPQGVPRHLQIAMEIESPMLCARFTELKEEDQDEVRDSPNWVYETKYDGVRMLIIFDGSTVAFYSRNVSTVSFCPILYDNIWHKADVEALKEHFTSFVIDTEILCYNKNVNTIMESRGVITETHLQAVQALLGLNKDDSIRIQIDDAPLYFKAFDVLMMNDDWSIMDMPWWQRRHGLEAMVEMVKASGMDISSTDYVDLEKQAYYDRIVDDGGEGVVAKYKDSPYIASENRSKKAWVKLKRSMADTLSSEYGDTLDGWIAGFDPGEVGKAHENKVGTIKINIWVKDERGNLREHEVANISGLTDELRDRLTAYDAEGNLMLNPEYLDRVVEIDGQCVSSRNLRVRHARLIRFRPDKYKNLCQIEENTLKKLVL